MPEAQLRFNHIIAKQCALNSCLISLPHQTFLIMNLLEQLHNLLDPNTISQLKQHIGAESEEQTSTAATGILATLVAGLAKNAHNPEGSGELVSAIDLDHDGGLLDDIPGYLFGNRQAQNPKMTNSAGILGHILGGNQSRTTDMLSKVTGLQKSQITKLLITLAPMVLAFLGRARHKNNMDVDGIGGLLRNSVDPKTNPQKEMGLLQRFLDKNGDGKVMDDIVNMGKGIFGRKG